MYKKLGWKNITQSWKNGHMKENIGPTVCLKPDKDKKKFPKGAANEFLIIRPKIIRKWQNTKYFDGVKPVY